MRRSTKWIWSSALALGVTAGCESVENRLVYYPTPVDKVEAPPAPLQDVTFTTASGVTIQARWAPHPQAQGAILLCHGNAGNLEGRAKSVRDLWDGVGESVLIFDYPGFGRSAGTPNEKGCYEAAAAAHEWLTNVQKIPPDRILIYGESLGGGVAVDLASHKAHRALILVRTFTSLPEVADYQMPLLPASWMMTNRYDSLSKIPACTRPTFFAQADKDAIIPYRHGEKLFHECRASKELYCLRGLGHNDPLPPEFYRSVRNFLTREAPPTWLKSER